jgi:hypothetical protein
MDETIAQILKNLAIKDGVYKEGDSLETIQKKLSKKRRQGHKQKYTYR